MNCSDIDFHPEKIEFLFNTYSYFRIVLWKFSLILAGIFVAVIIIALAKSSNKEKILTELYPIKYAKHISI